MKDLDAATRFCAEAAQKYGPNVAVGINQTDELVVTQFGPVEGLDQLPAEVGGYPVRVNKL